jgi:alkanesulfonate monooxygenase SsuD/methylene tetrahydromethanopterin reductase-like flavin-dependent oxidoreductase (luciferase family)
MAMRYALDVAPLGEFADPRVIRELAGIAEASGWDGVSTWDGLGIDIGPMAADPFLALAAAAASTERIALIAAVIVLPRRRPQLVAQSAATLDLLSGGRLILGVGAGADKGDYLPFGETAAYDERIARMDEAIDIVDRLLRGETVHHAGPAYTVDGVAVGPRPAQLPRPPMWLGAVRPGGVRKAARLDGWSGVATEPDPMNVFTPPDRVAQLVGIAREERASLGRTGEPFDVSMFGIAGAGGFSPAEYERAGVTWWLESTSPMRGSLADMRAIAKAGPPR